MEIWSVVEYNFRKIFLEKSYRKCGGGTCSPRLFYQKSRMSIPLDQQSEML